MPQHAREFRGDSPKSYRRDSAQGAGG